jgi:hypothetical protein
MKEIAMYHHSPLPKLFNSPGSENKPPYRISKSNDSLKSDGAKGKDAAKNANNNQLLRNSFLKQILFNRYHATSPK